MADKNTQTPQKAENRQTATGTPNNKTVAESTYTIQEFAAAPNVLGAKNTDIVTAALKLAGKETYTVSEAKEIVKKFKEKEVK